MMETKSLSVSLTKNGYLKAAEVLIRRPTWEVLDHIEGTYDHINLQRSQVANMMNADPQTGQLPLYWERAKELDENGVWSFVFLSAVFSHHRLINAFKKSVTGLFQGTLQRHDLPSKEFTNIAFSLASLDLCSYKRGSGEVHYDLYPVIYDLREASELVKDLLREKLKKCGWLDPDQYPHSNHLELLDQCKSLGWHKCLALDWTEFAWWMNGELEMESPPPEYFPTSFSIRKPR